MTDAKTLIKGLVAESGSRMVTVEFTKRTNGERRKMNCNFRAGRQGTKLGKKVRTGEGMKYDPLEKGLLPVIDMDLLKKNKDNPRKAWRSINFTQGNVVIKTVGRTIVLEDGEIVRNSETITRVEETGNVCGLSYR